MMSNNFPSLNNSHFSVAKTVWRNVAVAVFVVCFALIGLGVTVLPTRADSTNADGDFILTAENITEPIRGTWAECYAVIKTNPDVTHTVTMQNDWYPNQQVNLNDGGKIIFDLNGYTLDGSNYVNDLTDNGSFFNKNKGDTAVVCEFEITDSRKTGRITNFSTNIIVLSRNSKIKISGGTYTNSDATYVSGYPDIEFTQGCITQIHSYYIFATTGYITISGGEIYDNYCSYNILHGSGATLTVTGGKIYNNHNKNNYDIDVDDFSMSGGFIDSNSQTVLSPVSTQTATMTGGKIIGNVELPAGVNFVLGDNIEPTADGYIEKTHSWGDWVIDEPATDDMPGSRHRECIICYQIETKTIPQNVFAPVNVTYDGTDQQIANLPTKPDWYNDGMQITYTQNGVDVTTAKKDVGEYRVNVQWGEYTRTTTLTVAPKVISVTGVTANDKTYDRGRETTINTENELITGLVTGDDVVINYRGLFADKNVSDDKPVTITMNLTGTDTKNYVLAESQFTTTAKITPRSVVVNGIVVEDKEYDGTTRANINTRYVNFTGFVDVAQDDLTVAVNGEYDRTAVGENLTVSLVNMKLDGKDANNYVIASTSQKEVTNCRIKKRVITVTITDQTVKVATPQPILTAKITSGSLASGDTADSVYTLSIVVPTDPENSDATINYDHLPVGEYVITGESVNDNYDVTFVPGTYKVLTAEAWDALQTNEEEKEDNHLWLIIIIVIAVAAFIGALVGVGLVIRSYDKNREPKPQKEKK